MEGKFFFRFPPGVIIIKSIGTKRLERLSFYPGLSFGLGFLFLLLLLLILRI